MTASLRIVIPSLPPVEFSPNSRLHWRSKHKAGIQSKNDVMALVLEQGWQGPALRGAKVTISWGLPNKRVIDWDNLVARTKPCLDALVDAGVLVGDSVRDYTPEYRWFYSKNNPQTIIDVRET